MRGLLTIAGLAAAGYVVVLAMVYFNQERMLFLPSRALVATPRDAGLDYRDVRLATADGETLHGWLLPAAAPAAFTLLFFHGNAGNISHRLQSLALFHRLRVDVLIIDYRGYGESTGKPSEAGTYLDADAAWRYLTEERGIDPAAIVLFGRSLGGAVAIELAARTPAPAAGLIVESTFTSVPDLAAELYPFLPSRRLSRLRYAAAARIANVRCPVLVLHSRDDEIIPYAHGLALHAAAREPKTLFAMRGGHNDGFVVSGRPYERALGDFIAGLSHP